MFWGILFFGLWIIGIGAVALVVIDDENLCHGHGKDDDNEE